MSHLKRQIQLAKGPWGHKHGLTWHHSSEAITEQHSCLLFLIFRDLRSGGGLGGVAGVGHAIPYAP